MQLRQQSQTQKTKRELAVGRLLRSRRKKLTPAFGNPNENQFQDIQFGETFSRDFVDSREDAEYAEGLMNLHNNEAGRRVRFGPKF